MSVNDITGDPIRTDIPSDHYKNGWEAIWGKPSGKFLKALSTLEPCSLDSRPKLKGVEAYISDVIEVTSDEDEAWDEMERK